MRKVNLISIVITLLIILSCSSENPVEVKENLLEKNILGVWTDNENYSIQFYNNGSFKDSTYYPDYDFRDGSYDPTIIVRIGKYILTDSTLFITNFNFEKVQLNESVAVLSYSQEYKIEIVDNILKRIPVTIFESVGNTNNEIYGIWKSEGWQCGYAHESYPELLNGSGIYNRVFEFIKDSTKFKASYETDIPEYNIKTSWLDYSYLPPLVEISDSYPSKFEVEFESNKMIWYHKDESSLLKDLFKIE